LAQLGTQYSGVPGSHGTGQEKAPKGDGLPAGLKLALAVIEFYFHVLVRSANILSQILLKFLD
jgi:hypothetical protein